jgi:aryl-alcohol dehydrogenase-like predicted oxidoreductase
MEHLRRSGKARRIGVSCDDAATALAALDDDRIEVVEVPLWPASEITESFVHRAQQRGTQVLARGLVGSVLAQPRRDPRERTRAIASALKSALASESFAHLIVGTTREEHLAEMVSALQNNDARL